MKTVTSRDLAHRPREIRRWLAAGHTLRWTAHGTPVALIQPASAKLPADQPDWVARARAAGAVNRRRVSLAQAIYRDRD